VTRVIGLRLVQLVPVLFLVSVATFLMLELVPGDPAAVIAGPNATPEQYQEIRDELGLDEPIVSRYLDWLGGVVTGDFGRSLLPPEQEVSEMIKARLPVTLEITLLGMLLALVIAIPVALLSASQPGAVADRATSAGAFAAIAIPGFLTALLLIYLFVFRSEVMRWVVLIVGLISITSMALPAARAARRLRPGPDRDRSVRHIAIAVGIATTLLVMLFLAFPEFPRQGFVRITDDEGLGENLRSAFLPALTLGLTEAAVWMRLLRGDLLSTLQEDYILSARAKGMPKWRIMWRDALRPSSFSLITIIGVSLGRAIGGTVIVEQIFNLPGMGTMMINAINSKDYPVVQSTVLLIAVFYVLVNAFVDVSYSFLDPRIRRGRV
jgi:peptide/nickel transport system permease protein